MARLKEVYEKEITPMLVKKHGYKSVMQVPKITKITLNMGVGEAVADKKVMGFAVNDLQLISGQKPIITNAKKSIAGFKIRDGWPIGCKVTLRKKRMYEFLDRLVNVAMPRIRDFRGFSIKSMDGTGNYSLGIKEQIVFAEVDYEKIDKIRGLDICITTTAKTNEEAISLLRGFNFPFKEQEKGDS